MCDISVASEGGWSARPDGLWADDLSLGAAPARLSVRDWVPLEMTSPVADSPLGEVLKARINGSFLSALLLLHEGTSAGPLHHNFLGSKPRGER